MSNKATRLARELIKSGVRCDHVMTMPLSGEKAYAFRLEYSAPLFAKKITAYGDERAKGERERYTDVLKYAQSLADEEFGQEVSANDISRLADALRALKEKPASVFGRDPMNAPDVTDILEEKP